MLELWRRCRHLVDRLIPRFDANAGTDSSLGHRYYQFLCSIIVGFFIIFAANSFRLGLPKLGIAQLIVIGIIFLSIFVYHKTRSIVWAVNTILALTSPVTFYRALILGGMDSPMIFGWPVIATLTLMTLPLRWALVWTGVHLGFSFYFYFAELMGVTFEVTGPLSVVSNVRIAMICAVQVILFFSVYLIRRLNADLRRQLHTESEEVINVVRALSHDLSSPMMTLSHWVRTLQKKGLCPDLPKEKILQILKDCRETIDQTRMREAAAAGKSGLAKAKSEDPEEQLAQTMFKFTIILLVSVFASFGAYCMAVGSYKVGLLQWAVSLASFIGWTIYRRTGSVVAAGNFIMFLGSISGFFRAQMMGGITSPAFYIWPIVPVFTGALLPIRHAAFWTSLYIGMAIYYDIAARTGVEFTSLISPGAVDQIRIVAVCVVQVVVVVTIYYLKAQNAKFRTLIEEQKIKRVDLLKFLSTQVGAPLREIQNLVSSAGQSELTEVRRSLRACLDVVKLAEGWVESLDGKSEGSVDLREIVDEVSFLQESALRNKSIQWQTNVLASDPPIVRGEKICFAYQILNNLVSNSIKFTPEGGSIAVGIHSSPEYWELVINDTGIGIPKPLLAQIFDSNVPTTRDGTNSEKGTGFGMPIVKMFVEKYDGAIDITSQPIDLFPHDHGTQIRIRLPKIAA